MDEEIDLRDHDGPPEIDLTDRLRFAADSLAADFGDALNADDVEALVFSSAEGLLATASVRDFVPIFAERRARLAVRSGAAAPVSTAVPPMRGAETPVTAAIPPATAAQPPADLEPEPAVLEATPVDFQEEPPPAPAAPPVATPDPTNGSAAEPLLAVPVDDLNRLRDRVDRVRVRVSDWRADLDRR